MDSKEIAALVKTGAPAHAGHTQELLELDAIDRVVKLMCSCTVGLTIKLPSFPSEAVTPAPVIETVRSKKGG